MTYTGLLPKTGPNDFSGNGSHVDTRLLLNCPAWANKVNQAQRMAN